MQVTPPGPNGEPLFGSGRQYSANPLRFVADVERAYNGIATFDMGPTETFLISDPDAIESILVGESERYQKPEFQSDQLGDLLGEGLLLSKGDTWQQQRELANPAFSMGRLASFDDRIAEHTTDLLSDWEGGETRDIELEMTRVTIDVIADLMLGTDLTESQLSRLRENLEPIGKQFEPNALRFALPSWVPLPGDRTYQAAVEEVDAVVEEIIADRRGTAGGEDGPMDLLSILLRARDRGEQSAQQLRDEVVTMLLAGHDTTALTLTFSWYLLAEHPEKRARLQAAVDDLDGAPTIEELRDLDYLEWTINEAMRLYPPVYALFRESTEPVSLLGYDIPEGAMLMLPQWAVHRSPTYWEDPETFRPERWQSEKRGARPRFAYFPFGGGPRHCIGKNLAKLEAKIILAVIAQEYELEYDGPSPPPLQPSLTLHPRDGMEMELQKR